MDRCPPLAQLHERLEAERRMRETRLSAIEREIMLAKSDMDRRLETMNEFREALRDQAARFVTRMEMEAMHAPVLSDLRLLRESRAELQGKASQQSVTTATVFAVIGVLIGATGIVLYFVR